ncbi:hypothetical protein ACHHYP_03805 [Achlya hypogyna]|uniref:Uncharacterized protein n=1 Tax=Achlya hypogyna TaxID=1202772 RepID=A0A1V9Z2Z5_ACHHY|nr:hypothetical protein ACHHYP_03805 [Achlya hypogyna]
MQRSRAARRASAPSILPSKGVRLEPHEEEEDVNQTDDSADGVEKEPAPPLSPEKDATAHDGSDDNQADELSPDDHALPEPEAPSPRRCPPMAWIVSWNKRAVWPGDLADVHAPLRPFAYAAVDRVATASRLRAASLDARAAAARAHNHRVALTVLLLRDAAAAGGKAGLAQIAGRLTAAEVRRSACLATRQSTAHALMTGVRPESPVEADGASVWEASQARQASARLAREDGLKEKVRRAGRIGDRAKDIAADVAALYGQYAVLATQDLQQRLARAEVRRLIRLDKRRLAAGRHGNYVRSVYLTTKYLARCAGERLVLQLEAATARRRAALDAIATRTRRHNLSAQFRASCAVRLLDAQWLNVALRSSSAQQSAALRRRDLLGERVLLLQAAAARRVDVREQRRHDTHVRCGLIGDALARRLGAADARRGAVLAATVARIAGRRDLLRARKWTAARTARRAAAWAIKDRLAQATKRREAFLERRRAACATRNWYARVVAHRQAEVRAEVSARLAARGAAAQTAAANRRCDQQRQIFCELVELRRQRVQHVLVAHAQLVARAVARKAAAAEMRRNEDEHLRARAAHARWLRRQAVAEARAHATHFRAQCLRSSVFARLRAATIRRALFMAAIRAASAEDAAKGEAARLRVEFARESTRAHLEFRLVRADEKRQYHLANKRSAAVFFAGQGELVRRRRASRVEARRLTLAYEMESAGLRKSILLTQKTRCHLIARAVVVGRQKCMAESLALQGVATTSRLDAAAHRRRELLGAKQETARRTSQRVTLARLERQSTAVVDAAIKTAMASTVALQAERRRVLLLQARQDDARGRGRRARDVARVQKAARRIKALALQEQSAARVEATTKRRDALMLQRKLGMSTLPLLQPYAGLQVIGMAIPLPKSA